MRLIKKLLLCSLVLMMVGCTPKTPEQIYTIAMENLVKTDALDASIVSIVSMKTFLKNVDICVNSSLKAIDMQSEDMKIAVTNTIDGLSLTNVNMYYSDGYFYTESMGRKSKEAVALEDARLKLNVVTKLLNYGVDALVNLQAEEIETDTKLTFSLNEEAISELTELVMNYLQVDYDVKVSEVHYSMLVSDEYAVEEQTIDMALSVNILGQDVPVDLTMNLIVNGIEEAVELTLPDLSDYGEGTQINITINW